MSHSKYETKLHTRFIIFAIRKPDVVMTAVMMSKYCPLEGTTQWLVDLDILKSNVLISRCSPSSSGGEIHKVLLSSWTKSIPNWMLISIVRLVLSLCLFSKMTTNSLGFVIATASSSTYADICDFFAWEENKYLYCDEIRNPFKPSCSLTLLFEPQAPCWW